LNENQLSNSKCGREVCLEKEDSDLSNFRIVSFDNCKEMGEIVMRGDMVVL
jgi:hypothetical protein